MVNVSLLLVKNTNLTDDVFPSLSSNVDEAESKNYKNQSQNNYKVINVYCSVVREECLFQLQSNDLGQSLPSCTENDQRWTGKTITLAGL